MEHEFAVWSVVRFGEWFELGRISKNVAKKPGNDRLFLELPIKCALNDVLMSQVGRLRKEEPLDGPVEHDSELTRKVPSRAAGETVSF